MNANDLVTLSERGESVCEALEAWQTGCDPCLPPSWTPGRLPTRLHERRDRARTTFGAARDSAASVYCRTASSRVGHEYCKTRIARCIECERLLADHEVRVCAECFSEAMSVPR